MKVVVADQGYHFKCVGLLEDSEDEVAWMNAYLTELESHSVGPRIYAFKVWEFDENNKPAGLGGAMVYPVNTDATWYGKVSETA